MVNFRIFFHFGVAALCPKSFIIIQGVLRVFDVTAVTETAIISRISISGCSSRAFWKEETNGYLKVIKLRTFLKKLATLSPNAFTVFPLKTPPPLKSAHPLESPHPLRLKTTFINPCHRTLPSNIGLKCLFRQCNLFLYKLILHIFFILEQIFFRGNMAMYKTYTTEAYMHGFL